MEMNTPVTMVVHSRSRTIVSPRVRHGYQSTLPNSADIQWIMTWKSRGYSIYAAADSPPTSTYPRLSPSSSLAEQKRGYKDQWPFSVRIYKDTNTGKPKGDCIIKYEEPNSAHAALRWFDGIDFKGGKIGVAMAAKPSLNNRY